jgi:uncharacterized protein (TIGR00369 family)
VDKNSFFWKMVDGRMAPPACAKTLGLEFVEIDGERGTIETKFEARAEFLNPVGNVQGGFLAAMLDDTMGTALSATLDLAQFAPAVNLNVQFHRPARLGSLKGLGRVVMRGREACHGSAELWQNDKIVATPPELSSFAKIQENDDGGASGTERAGAGGQGLPGFMGPVSQGLPGADLAAE